MNKNYRQSAHEAVKQKKGDSARLSPIIGLAQDLADRVILEKKVVQQQTGEAVFEPLPPGELPVSLWNRI